VNFSSNYRLVTHNSPCLAAIVRWSDTEMANG